MDADFTINSVFKAIAPYVGGFVELGAHITSWLDGYARYSYNYTGSMKKVIDTVEFSYSSTNSHRIRAGIKLNMGLTHKIKPYLNLALERELNGKTRGVIVSEGQSAFAITKGNTGIVACGVDVSLNRYFTAHVNAEATLGRRRGFSGNLGLEYHLWAVEEGVVVPNVILK